MRMRLSVCAAAFLFLFFAAAPAYALVNINTASVDELDTLPHVGTTTAQYILDGRPYTSVQEISKVKGIGEPGSKTYEDIIGLITVSDGAAYNESAGGSESNAGTAGESENTDSDSEEAHPETDTGGSSASSGTLGTAIIPDLNALFLDIGGSTRTVFVGADSVFEARLSGWRGAPLTHARITWSFGNGARTSGYAVRYRFPFPGSYAVVADVVYGDRRTSARSIVSAIPSPVAITAVTDEYIALKNEGKSEVDIGGWFLFSAGEQFLFPEHTVILPGASVMVPHAYSGLSAASPDTVALQFPNGTVAASFFSPAPPAPAARRAAAASEAAATFRPSAPLIAAQGIITAPIVAAGPNAPFGNVLPPIALWLFALAVLIGSAATGVVFVRNNTRRQGYVVQEIHE